MAQHLIDGEQYEEFLVKQRAGEEIEIKNDSGNPLVVEIGGTGSSQLDAFGRQRMSEPFTLFDSTLRYTKRTDLWNETLTASGTVNYLVNESSLELKTTTASGDAVLRRTRRNFPYQPGKSLLILQSFVGETVASGLVQEVGYFDDNNGVMVRASGTTLQMVVRSTASGTVQETVVNQDSWNVDTYSALRFDKSNIFAVDLEWLGVGRVRTGFVVSGVIQYCHEFNNANARDEVYMTTAILPLSYRIANISAQESGRTFKQVCSSVISEGGYEPSGPVYTGGAGVAGSQTVTSETLFAAIRMASGRTDNIILPAQVDAAVDGNALSQWRLYRNPTVSGTWSAAQNGRGNVEVMASGTLTGGTIVAAGMLSSRGSVTFSPSSALALSLGKDANGNSDVLALTIENAGNMKTGGLIGWREFV